MRTTWLATCSCAPACGNTFTTTRTARVEAGGRLTAGRCASCAEARSSRLPFRQMAALVAQIATGYGPIEALGATQGEPCGCGGYEAAQMDRLAAIIRSA
jgi:hypothetical protein